MRLPFSESQFLDVFEAYNSISWPTAVLAWAVALILVLQLVRGREQSGPISLFAAILWAWDGLVYHAIFFTRINPAAWVFAILFVAQGLAFIWFGLVTRRLRFEWGRTRRHALSAAFITYSLLYPVIVTSSGHAQPRAPSFGVPCPTTLLTAGLLFAARAPVPRWLLVVPMFWSFVGGSAAFLLGMTPDLMLLAAAGGLGALAVQTRIADDRGSRQDGQPSASPVRVRSHANSRGR